MSRRQLARVLEASGALEAVLKRRVRTPCPWLTVLTYHRLASDPGRQPFEPGVVDASPLEFDARALLAFPRLAEVMA